MAATDEARKRRAQLGMANDLGLERVEDLARNDRRDPVTDPQLIANAAAAAASRTTANSWQVAVANNEFGADDDAQDVAGLDSIANGNLHRINRQAATRGGFSGGQRGRGGANTGRFQPPMNHRNHNGGAASQSVPFYDPTRPMARPRDERNERVTHPRDSYQVNPDAVSMFGAVQPPGGGGTKRWAGSPKPGAPAPLMTNSAGSSPSNARLVANVRHQTGPPKPIELVPHQRASDLTFHLDVKGKVGDLKTTSYVRVFAYEHPGRETDILEIHQSTGTVHREDIRSLINPFDNGGANLTIRRKGLDGIVKAIKIRFANNQAVTMAKNVLFKRAQFRKTSTAPRYPDLVFEGMEFGVIDVSSILALNEQPAVTAAQPSMAATASEQVVTMDAPIRLSGPMTENTAKTAICVGPGLEKAHKFEAPIDHRTVALEDTSHMADIGSDASMPVSDRYDSLAGVTEDNLDKSAHPVDPNPVLVDLNPEASEEPAGIIDFGIPDSEKTAVSALAELLVLVAPALEDSAAQQPLINLGSEDSPEKPQRPLENNGKISPMPVGLDHMKTTPLGIAMSRGTMVVLSRLKHGDYYHLLNTANQSRTQEKVPGETREEKLEEATLQAAWKKLKADQDFNGFSIEEKKKTVAFVYHNLRFLQSNTRRIYSMRDMKAVKEQKRTALIKTFTKSEYVPEQQDMVKKVPPTANAGKGRSLETPPPDSTPKQAPISRDAHAASLTLPENRGKGALGFKGLGGSLWAV